METKTKAAASIDEYIAAFPPETQKILQKLRLVIHAAAPEAKETISYQIPTFKMKRNLVHFGAWRDHISLYPTSSGVSVFARELAEYEFSKGTIKFPIDKELPWDLITRIVKFRLEEEAARGK